MLLIAGFGIFVLFSNFIIMQIFYYFLYEVIYESSTMSSMEQQNLFALIQEIKSKAMIFNSCTFILFFFVFFLLGLRITHNAAGAVYRFKMEFEKMKANGKLHPLNLRGRDFFQGVRDSFNSMVKSIGTQNKGFTVTELLIIMILVGTIIAGSFVFVKQMSKATESALTQQTSPLSAKQICQTMGLPLIEETLTCDTTRFEGADSKTESE